MEDPTLKTEEPVVLIMTSVKAEKEAIERGLKGSHLFKVVTTGVGPAKAAATTAVELTKHTYKLVINMGIGGGFVGKAGVSSTVVADLIIAADLGSESEEGFLPIEELGMGQSVIATDTVSALEIVEALNKLQVEVCYAPILTLATVTGTTSTTQALQERYPEAAAEAMEGHGVATAAELADVPVMEIRTISNQIGPRDREAWRIKEALLALEGVGHALTEVWS
ncbi:futalosine hydrolase [Alkalicoccobacillus porphyridii]|uniref:Futalosine hydrolase n=1 Tax=Alkalicoccobacillus porphyridii TaxID=2597270 RepID=A0A553ZVU8_9BACI|nr:futalosine hydrolase [Alkalicoccobacillus porphyridii]TSB45436.1 futalosine hydrolase [Alkalicoccobacillus porphyridii]